MSTSPIVSTISAITGTVNTNSVTEFVCTSNQTTFTISYTVGELMVFLNGVLLDNGVDYTATNGTSVVLTNGAAADDVLTINTDKLEFTATGATAATEAFKTIAVSGQTDVVADSATDTLTLAAGSNVTITTAAGSDTITFASSGATVDDATALAIALG
tara:strand:+ start:3048 stop:3524 length:477 start_codon:yes stop_codon:yes gene_type:complete